MPSRFRQIGPKLSPSKLGWEGRGGQIRIKRDVIFAFMLMTTFLCPCCMTSLVPLPAILSLTAACPADSTFRVCLGGCFIYLVIYSFYHHNCPVRGQLSSGMGLTEETHLHIPLPSCHQRTSPATTTRVHSGEQISEKAPAPSHRNLPGYE